MATVDGVEVVIPPPDGYVVNFDDPQRQYVLANYIAAAIGMFLALLCLGQRLWVRAFIMRSFGIDDACCIVAWMFTVAMQGLMIYGFADGLYGVHAWEISAEKFGRYVLIANYVQAIIYVPPTMLSKLALLIFYLKLQNRALWYQICVWSTIFITIGYNIGIMFSVAFACDPIAMAYDITVTDGTCINQAAVFKATAAFGIVTDVLIFLIPIPMVISLHLSRKKKIGLLALFAVGSATVVTSIVRLVLLMENLSKADLTWIGGPVFLWVSIEANLLIICSCLPTLKAFFQSVAPRLIGYSSRDAKYGSNYASNSAGLGNSYARRGQVSTISSSNRPKPNRDNYFGFDSDEETAGYRMETLVEGGPRKGQRGAAVSISGANGMDIESSRESGDKDRDDDSAKAIIHTKTVQVSYEDRPS